MARKVRVSKGKTMIPNYFVFCEGDTEVAYTEMLRAHYRLPIHIIAKKTLLNITPTLIERCKSVYVLTKNDRTYLMYDLDVDSMLKSIISSMYHGLTAVEITQSDLVNCFSRAMSVEDAKAAFNQLVTRLSAGKANPRIIVKIS